MKTVTLYDHTLNINNTSKEVIFLSAKQSQDVNTIVVEKNQHAVLLELQQVQTAQITKKIIVQENASLEYIKIQENHNDNTCEYHFELFDNASCNMVNFEQGQYKQINYYTASLEASNTTLLLNGLVKLNQTQACDNHFNIVHQEQNTHSNVAYKHVLHDQSKALFQALTQVNNTALYAKAFQNSNTLLLSDDATIFTQPHLEIAIDELQASHGATTGSLNQDELLYLQSRGIEEEKAKAMLLKAFENELFDKISNEEAKEYIKNYKRSYDD